MGDEIHIENEAVGVMVQVRWLSGPHGIYERRQQGEISALLEVLIVKGTKVA